MNQLGTLIDSCKHRYAETEIIHGVHGDMKIIGSIRAGRLGFMLQCVINFASLAFDLGNLWQRLWSVVTMQLPFNRHGLQGPLKITLNCFHGHRLVLAGIISTFSSSNAQIFHKDLLSAWHYTKPSKYISEQKVKNYKGVRSTRV